ncbi:MAG: glutathione S-transferase family protein [Bdellovibrionota bacterium]
MLKFFYSTATCSTVTHIALEEAALPFTGVEVSWSRNLNVSELAKVSPLGAVPALEIDGKLLTQTPAILEYIAEAAPTKNLLAKAGSFERLETLSWVAFASADFQKAYAPIFLARRLNLDDKAKAELRTSSLKNVEKYVAHLDANLAGKDFIMGKQFTIADAALFTFLGWTTWVEFDTTPYKNVTAYMKRIYARPAVQKVLKAEELLGFVKA